MYRWRWWQKNSAIAIEVLIGWWLDVVLGSCESSRWEMIFNYLTVAFHDENFWSGNFLIIRKYFQFWRANLASAIYQKQLHLEIIKHLNALNIDPHKNVTHDHVIVLSHDHPSSTSNIVFGSNWPVILYWVLIKKLWASNWTLDQNAISLEEKVKMNDLLWLVMSCWENGRSAIQRIVCIDNFPRVRSSTKLLIKVGQVWVDFGRCRFWKSDWKWVTELIRWWQY